MRILLDTHVFIWVVADSRRLRAPARALLASADEVWVSAASIWEIAIKSRIGKISGDATALANAIGQSGFRELPVLSRHSARVATLPLHHNDPFDRLLIAQAVCEPLRFVTADSALAAYGPIVNLIDD
jgi:PIN domain nuclease of toxin-antitoxin system